MAHCLTHCTDPFPASPLWLFTVESPALFIHAGEIELNKTEMVDQIAEGAGVSKKDAKGMLDAFTDAVGDALSGGDTIQLPGFGSFKVSERAARQGRNPQTGEAIDIAASRIPSFKAGKTLKDRVNG